MNATEQRPCWWCQGRTGEGDGTPPPAEAPKPAEKKEDGSGLMGPILVGLIVYFLWRAVSKERHRTRGEYQLDS